MKKKKQKGLKFFRSELRKAKFKIKKLEKALNEHKPTFYGWGNKTSATTTLNGFKSNVRFEKH